MTDTYDSFNSMKKINEAMQRTINPMYDFHKSLNFATSITDRASASLKSIQPLEEFNKMMGSINSPFSSYEKMIEDMDPLKKIQEQMDSLYSISDFSFENSLMREAKRFQDSLNIALDTTSIQKYHNLFSEQMKSYKKMEQSLATVSSSTIRSPYNSIDSVLKKILEQEHVIQSITLKPINNDALTELTLMKNEIFESLDNHHLKVEQQIEKIYTLLVSFKNPFLLAFFVSFIFPIVMNIFSSIIYDNLVKPTLLTYTDTKGHQTKYKKEVIHNAQSILAGTDALLNYRIVTADVLNVRDNDSVKSKVIAYTFFGEIVEIVNKKRNWCLIKRYDSENEKYIQGWVFTRYLGRIRQ